MQQTHPQAADRLLPLVYDELRRLAARKLAHEPVGQTLDATGLVHEAYLRLVEKDGVRHWEDRGRFFAAAAEAMRRILVDRARHKRSEKCGGARKREAFCETELAAPLPGEQLLAVDRALERLTAADPAAAELVKLRFFAGFSLAEAAEILRVSPRTADRLW